MNISLLHGMRPTTPGAAAVAQSLRAGSGPYLRGRRWALGADLTAITALGVVVLYQAGVLRHLPGRAGDPVAASPRAYWALHTPDAALGIASYAVSIGLATAGSAERYQCTPWLSYLFAAKLLGDGVIAAALLREEQRSRNGLCWWCLVASAAALFAAPVGIPEALAAKRRSRRRRWAR
jgi:Vitamin K epoxide reductase family